MPPTHTMCSWCSKTHRIPRALKCKAHARRAYLCVGGMLTYSVPNFIPCSANRHCPAR